MAIIIWVLLGLCKPACGSWVLLRLHKGGEMGCRNSVGSAWNSVPLTGCCASVGGAL